MPEMVFEYILKKKGIDPKKDLTIVQNINFGLTAEAFASGKGDYTVEFEPFAATLEAEKKGAVVASLGVESGKVPYTAFSAKKSYIAKIPKSFRASRMRSRRAWTMCRAILRKRSPK
jgi:NitT/TauT family transport system substrate-binding protein